MFELIGFRCYNKANVEIFLISISDQRWKFPVEKRSWGSRASPVSPYYSSTLLILYLPIENLPIENYIDRWCSYGKTLEHIPDFSSKEQMASVWYTTCDTACSIPSFILDTIDRALWPSLAVYLAGSSCTFCILSYQHILYCNCINYLINIMFVSGALLHNDTVEICNSTIA